MPAVDEALVERAKGGDKAALEALLAEVAPSVHRFGLRMCRHEADAEEVMQDTLLSIARNLKSFEGRSSLSSWVFTLARTACSRRRRGLKNQPHLSDEDAPEPLASGPDPEQHAVDRQLAHRVVAAIDALPPDQRDVLHLRDVEGLTGDETAAALGISLEAMKSRLHRARASLERTLRTALEPPKPSCPDVAAMFSRKLEDELDDRSCAQMQSHIEGCPRCAESCHALTDALSACRASSAKKVPPEVQARIRAAIRELLAGL
jgi:RNA polymerase sigma-70 factor (ECF subfamily)